MQIITQLIFIVLIIWLQIHLSKKQSKFFGLILPVISFLFALAYFQMTSTSVIDLETGEIIYQSNASTAPELGASILLLLISNFHTFILLAIYFACRSTLKQREPIENLQ